MYHINCKYLWVVVLITLIITETKIQIGHAQTNLQAIQDQIAELERKLTNVKARQEKAQSIQKQLEEQEQKLVNLEQYLSKSDKYKVQVIEIRMNVKNIHAKIEAITKERYDLEENLRLLKDLQIIMLRETSSENKAPKTILDPLKGPYWQINNIIIANHFDDGEREEIMHIFSSRSQLNQDILLNKAHQFYNKTGTVIHFIIHQKAENEADLEIILNQRARHSLTHYSAFPARNLFEFKANYFGFRIVND